jgi:hypothetical protein
MDVRQVVLLEDVIWIGVLVALVLLAREIGSGRLLGGAYRFSGHGDGAGLVLRRGRRAAR